MQVASEIKINWWKCKGNCLFTYFDRFSMILGQGSDTEMNENITGNLWLLDYLEYKIHNLKVNISHKFN